MAKRVAFSPELVARLLERLHKCDFQEADLEQMVRHPKIEPIRDYLWGRLRMVGYEEVYTHCLPDLPDKQQVFEQFIGLLGISFAKEYVWSSREKFQALYELALKQEPLANDIIRVSTADIRGYHDHLSIPILSQILVDSGFGLLTARELFSLTLVFATSNRWPPGWTVAPLRPEGMVLPVGVLFTNERRLSLTGTVEASAVLVARRRCRKTGHIGEYPFS